MTELTIPATADAPVAPPATPAPAAIEWDDEVKSAADYYGLTDYLPAAVRILRDVCPTGTVVGLKVSREPETAELRVVVVANMPRSTTSEQALACHEAVIDRRVTELPAHVLRLTTFALYRE